MEIIIAVVVLTIVAGFFLWRYKSKHPAGYAEHREEAKDIADALKKPFKK